MSATQAGLPDDRASLVPSPVTVSYLLAGGLAGLLAWEIWGRLIAPLVIGGPLEPQGLVTALSSTLLGVGLSKGVATAIHFAIGIAAYPAAYWVVSRIIPRWGMVFDIGVWLAFSMYFAWLLMSGTASGTAALLWFFVTFLAASRMFNPSSLLRGALSWGSFAWFNALGIMAPIAGMPFLLLGAADKLSLMSWAGHVVYGVVAVLVFEKMLSRKG